MKPTRLLYALPALAWAGLSASNKLPPWARTKARPFLQALHTLRGHPGRCWAALAVSLLHQVLTVGITLAVVRAFGLAVATPLLFALTPLVWLATFVPITLGGMGLRELAFMRLFAQGAVATEASLLMSLGTFGAMLLVALVGALWSFPMVRRSAKIHP